MTRVLIVDDQEENLYLLRSLFEGQGFEVVEASDGAEALELARQHKPDLVVSDLLMPGVDGYRLLRSWRADEVVGTVPFIVYTATYTTPRDERLALALGADLFLVKPAEPDVLLQGVADVLSHERQATLRTLPEDAALLREYTEVVVRKLEAKVAEVEALNEQLQDQIVRRADTEARLVETEARVRTTFEHVAVGIAHTTIDGTFVWVNDRLCQMTGYSRGELLGTTGVMLSAAEEDRVSGAQSRQELLTGDRPVIAALRRFRHKDGSLVWGNVVTALVRDRFGEPTHFVAIVVDVTEQRKNEEALLLRDRAIQQVSQGIVISDAREPDAPILYVNAGFEAITGYGPADVLGHNCRFLKGPETDAATVATIRDAVTTGHACAVEILNYRKDGTPFWNALSINPVRDTDGLVTHLVGVLDDITERRRLGDQLRQSQKMEAVGRLAGGVAHDFNNLLTIICGYADLLRMRSQLHDAEREMVNEIAAAGERASALTRQLLGFSRQTLLQPRVVDVNAVVIDTSRLLRRLLGEDILLTTLLAPELPPVKVDPGQLGQILMNLAVNSRDAMPRGGQLTVETARASLDKPLVTFPPGGIAGPHVLLAISDTGMGMTPEVQSRIFEPFYTTKEPDRGTGLGLSVVFGIVQQSGGRIHVYSEPGRGTTFKVYLPVVTESVAAPPTDLLDNPPHGTETILLVEDEPGVREFAATILALYGYTVLAAHDGADALRQAAASAQPIDLVLTDVVMPGMSGPELVGLLEGRSPGLKVVFMSGYTDDAVIRHGLLTADVAFIQKPYSAQALAEKVRATLDGRR
jgi:two-component system cell cycle sensor histidine kinase/response regulator CckA